MTSVSSQSLEDHLGHAITITTVISGFPKETGKQAGTAADTSTAQVARPSPTKSSQSHSASASWLVDNPTG